VPVVAGDSLATQAQRAALRPRGSLRCPVDGAVDRISPRRSGTPDESRVPDPFELEGVEVFHVGRRELRHAVVKERAGEASIEIATPGEIRSGSLRPDPVHDRRNIARRVHEPPARVSAQRFDARDCLFRRRRVGEDRGVSEQPLEFDEHEFADDHRVAFNKLFQESPRREVFGHTRVQGVDEDVGVESNDLPHGRTSSTPGPAASSRHRSTGTIGVPRSSGSGSPNGAEGTSPARCARRTYSAPPPQELRHRDVETFREDLEFFVYRVGELNLRPCHDAECRVMTKRHQRPRPPQRPTSTSNANGAPGTSAASVMRSRPSRQSAR
jgi:hypothetical protein